MYFDVTKPIQNMTELTEDECSNNSIENWNHTSKQ